MMEKGEDPAADKILEKSQGEKNMLTIAAPSKL